jgi:hypothetical protein
MKVYELISSHKKELSSKKSEDGSFFAEKCKYFRQYFPNIALTKQY